MARISGIDLPKNKRGEIGLTYIYGIGKSTASEILEKAGKTQNSWKKELWAKSWNQKTWKSYKRLAQ